MQFKAMKFWIGEKGDEDLVKLIHSTLSQLGYEISYFPASQIIFTDVSGKTDAYDSISSTRLQVIYHNSLATHQEINIDWMRKPEPKRSIVSIGDKDYYEDELAEALAGIKAICKSGEK